MAKHYSRIWRHKQVIIRKRGSRYQVEINRHGQRHRHTEENRGAPQYIRSDNGPEFISKNLRHWLSQRDIQPQYIEPGCPWQNGFAESFNGTFRRECLNREQLWSRGEAQAVCNWWREVYNFFRPHSSIDGKTPVEFAQGADFATLRQPPELERKMALLN